ncbi:MAG: M23 family metallopeptidase, partial [Clostridia bacterium]|nr:M23 family metallopeptidase [Clostridia bacterium]
DAFSGMLINAIRTPTVPETHKAVYQITLHTNTGTAQEYRFYFSEDSSKAYFGDGTGNLWQAREGTADTFLGSTFSFELYPASTPPVLTTAATEVIIPTELSWSYRTQKGSFADLTHITTTSEILDYSIANDVGFYFSLPPSSYEVVIRRGETELHRGLADNITLPQLAEDELLDFEINAIYNRGPLNDYSGTATYRFRMRAVEPANFSLDATPAQEGTFVLLTCRNVKIEQNLQISAEPALKSTPVIFKNGDLVYAAIPASEVGHQRLTVTYGTISDSFDLTVTPDTHTASHDFAGAELTGDWRAALDGGIDTLIRTWGAVGYAGAPIQQKPFAAPDTSAALGFGDTLTIDATFSASVPFELYSTTGAVHAKAAGRVVHIGESELLGKFVILDHGCGLYTWYCGLSDVHVSVSRPAVAVNDSIGIAGSTGLGLAGKDCVLILATLGRTAISPAFLRETAIVLP